MNLEYITQEQNPTPKIEIGNPVYRPTVYDPISIPVDIQKFYELQELYSLSPPNTSPPDSHKHKHVGTAFNDFMISITTGKD